MAISLKTDVNSEVELTAKQRQELMTQFRAYQKLKLQADKLQEQMNEIKAKIATMRDEAGVASIGINGYRTTLVAPVRGVFNKELFIAEGGDLSIYNKAVELRPTKSYELITLPEEGE